MSKTKSPQGIQEIFEEDFGRKLTEQEVLILNFSNAAGRRSERELICIKMANVMDYLEKDY